MSPCWNVTFPMSDAAAISRATFWFFCLCGQADGNDTRDKWSTAVCRESLRLSPCRAQPFRRRADRENARWRANGAHASDIDYLYLCVRWRFTLEFQSEYRSPSIANCLCCFSLRVGKYLIIFSIKSFILKQIPAEKCCLRKALSSMIVQI